MACSGIRKTTEAGPPVINAADRDGSSYQRAIIITETHEWQGIKAEYAWLEKQYPQYTIINHFLKHNGYTTFNIDKILTIEGKEITVYFDITNFFGNK